MPRPTDAPPITAAHTGAESRAKSARGEDPSSSSPPPIDAVIPHRPTEDVLGVVTGTFLASLGLYLLQSAGAVTGGTAGLALLLTHALSTPFAVLFLLVNLPFFVLALWKKRWAFTLKTLVCVGLISLFSLIHPRYLPVHDVPLPYAVIGGNLLVGVGLLIIFRHGASLGGFNILALILQERAGLRAGYVQMAMDVTVILLSLLVLDVPRVLLSAVGGMILNVVLALNHRPERYRA
ncbi:YitT family protein [Brachybacterium sp. MASK1Z-5]|uniref:YitT family protein n=1 Tax=Brachybacterium halotolerans TaxID=2795215 RepID=A0ABS1BA35_9MICO|nr:YitT family protein [Brachybacterium halotolerans]MBK0331520.1 YitT family protein [Brachybacterium halotolerans]